MPCNPVTLCRDLRMKIPPQTLQGNNSVQSNTWVSEYWTDQSADICDFLCLSCLIISLVIYVWFFRCCEWIAAFENRRGSVVRQWSFWALPFSSIVFWVALEFMTAKLEWLLLWTIVRGVIFGRGVWLLLPLPLAPFLESVERLHIFSYQDSCCCQIAKSVLLLKQSGQRQGTILSSWQTPDRRCRFNGKWTPRRRRGLAYSLPRKQTRLHNKLTRRLQDWR
jgi:hypothetical protein